MEHKELDRIATALEHIEELLQIIYLDIIKPRCEEDEEEA